METSLTKKMLAEIFGTAILVILGCGTAMLVGCDSNGSGYLLTAFAFGLAVVAMAYSIGNASGCHINPAISLAMWFRGDIKGKDFLAYFGSQITGGIIGAFILKAIWNTAGIEDKTGAFGSNGLAGVNGNVLTGIAVEILLTFIFVLAVMGATSKKAAHGSFGGLVAGLSLVVVHILGIGLTGTSVNPARSLGPALVAAASGNMGPLSEVWIFILAPLVGAICAAMLHMCLEQKNKPQDAS